MIADLVQNVTTICSACGMNGHRQHDVIPHKDLASTEQVDEARAELRAQHNSEIEGVQKLSSSIAAFGKAVLDKAQVTVWFYRIQCSMFRCSRQGDVNWRRNSTTVCTPPEKN